MANENREIPSDILTLLRARAATRKDAAAIETADGRMLSYADLAPRVIGLAGAIAASVPDRNGQRLRVGIVLPNGMDMAVTLLAVASVGAALPFNPGYQPAEFEAYFVETRIDALLVAMEDEGPAVDVARELDIPILRLAKDGTVVGAAPVKGVLPPPAPDDVALVLLTSGSTGRSKSVPLTHRNICTSAADVCRSMDLSSTDRCLSMWEQYHVGGLVDLLLAPLVSGGTVICTSGFDTAGFFRLLSAAKPTWYQAVPTTLNELVQHATRNGLAVAHSSLRLIRSVAAALPPRLMGEVETLFGVPVIQTFGMTEAGPLITSTRLPPALRKPGSVGRSCGPEIRIVGAQGETLAPGSPGEVAVRGANVFSGYENDARANAAQFRDSWFHTGDIGYLDGEGDLFLTGRIKQLINRGGEKVNPQEVDEVLAAYPAVAEAASFPVPHPTLGEDVAAAVVLAVPGASEGEIRAFLVSRLAAFKVPQRIHIVDRLPRNSVGKIDRIALSAAYARGTAAGAPGGEVTSLEARVAKIWAGELNLPSVGPDDNFFEIGGDSLAAVRVFLAIEAELGRPLPEDVLTSITTVRDMVRAIEQSPAPSTAVVNDGGIDAGADLTQAEQRSLASVMAMGHIPVVRPGSGMKVLNAGGKRRPLFWCFNSPAREMSSLAAALGPAQPLYGLYSGGRLFKNSDDIFDRLASHYAKEILAVDGEGPYFLGGNCKGAWIAVRIARALTAAGKRVEALCLLEHSDPELADFDGRLLLLFGKQSKLRAYRAVEWGSAGWAHKFRHAPQAAWVGGGHTDFFRRDNVSDLARRIALFLDGEKQVESASSQTQSAILMAIHRTPGLFGIYRMIHRARDRLRYGRKVRVSPFTGEPA